VSQLFFQMNES